MKWNSYPHINHNIRGRTDPLRTAQDYAKGNLSWHPAVEEIEENLADYTNKEIAEIILHSTTV
jgi:hypothetical protein